ncbi:MAG: dihydroorotate dehydrogenase electron transfer subunit [Gammaproteobacteria bacterium]|nr:dihydroorotate dehydrogenase electron transfer subunit [Gammaproteobacteria bacterium]MBU1654858.1 dihydroorotate dehydrogenase electron transfer subunit [Gammaproteobacteria bacterium]MBU1961149.1 dihydroorotate dehydrogenase electron transfer subunit [Gammaproteobacteria bacterium]
MNAKTHRDTIFNEQAQILCHEHLAGEQHILRLQAPDCAAQAKSGQFVHLQVHPQRPLRRPISLMRTSPGEGWIELLYKAVGEGTRLLAERMIGETIDLLGPIGTPFRVTGRRPLLIGGGVGMPPMLFLTEDLKRQGGYSPFVILGSEVPFPFQPKPSQIHTPQLPPHVMASMPLLDDWGIPCRLASLRGFPGCHEGYVTDLARLWLDGLAEEARREVEILACGPHPMLVAVARLAKEYALPCQVSLEEFMACGVGGCAGCVVPVATAEGIAMKRVCVDGPVFDARQVLL